MISEIHGKSSIEEWLCDVHSHVANRDPNILPLFGIYEGEARFGRHYLESDLERLAKGAVVLELGAGSLLLSCQLVREGYQVTALEPIGEGFSHFKRLRELVLERAVALDCVPQMINQRAEELALTDCFDYAFSINVMEHVVDVRRVIVNVELSLRPAATYRFTCPNYFFPYEPHFNIPTFFSKKMTEWVFRKKIFMNSVMEDPKGTWNSLNWITVSEISEIVRQRPHLEVSFNRFFLAATLERVGADRSFALRRSDWMRMLILLFLKLRGTKIASFIPVIMQPNIDCFLTKTITPGGA